MKKTIAILAMFALLTACSKPTPPTPAPAPLDNTHHYQYAWQYTIIGGGGSHAKNACYTEWEMDQETKNCSSYADKGQLYNIQKGAPC